MINNPMCAVCHQKNNSSKLNQLRLIKTIIQNNKVSIDNISIRHRIFSWYINDNCRFGVPCTIINRQNMESKRIAHELEPYLVAIATNSYEISHGNKDMLYHDILRLLSGHFPNIYHSMEQLHQGGFKSCYTIA